MQAAKSTAARLSVTLTLRQDRYDLMSLMQDAETGQRGYRPCHSNLNWRREI